MLLYILILSLLYAGASEADKNLPAQDTVRVEKNDTLPREIPDLLSPELFIPKDHLLGYEPWDYAPFAKPVFPILDVYGFDGSIGFGEYSLQHPEKFFSTLEGYNMINIPQLYVSQQMMLGNTLKLGRNIYFLSGILYGAQLGVMGNNWGMGTREGFIWHPSPMVSVMVWSQYFQSVEVYSPVLFPNKTGDGAAIRMPATPEVFSFGVQASFTVGEFIIGIGTSISPTPVQDRPHTEIIR